MVSAIVIGYTKVVMEDLTYLNLQDTSSLYEFKVQLMNKATDEQLKDMIGCELMYDSNAMLKHNSHRINFNYD